MCKNEQMHIDNTQISTIFIVEYQLLLSLDKTNITFSFISVILFVENISPHKDLLSNRDISRVETTKQDFFNYTKLRLFEFALIELTVIDRHPVCNVSTHVNHGEGVAG